MVGIFVILFLTHLILKYTQYRNDYLWYRQFWSYRKLAPAQKTVLENYAFFQNLNPKNKKEFEHRVVNFIADKDYRHRYNKPVTDEQKVLIAAVACRLTFGRRSYLFPMLNTILLFDEAFQSPSNENFHKGEYNPAAEVLALSWEDFKEGMDITNDNLHLGLHEFTHVIHIESDRYNDTDAMRYEKYHQLILHSLMQPELRAKLDDTRFFRDYAFTNQYEFMAVLTEYFFESTEEFRTEFPDIFGYMKKALLYKDEWLQVA